MKYDSAIVEVMFKSFGLLSVLSLLTEHISLRALELTVSELIKPEVTDHKNTP